MDKNLIGKKIKINTKKGFFYEGKLISIDENYIWIDDKIKGEMAIPHDSVERIEGVKE